MNGYHHHIIWSNWTAVIHSLLESVVYLTSPIEQDATIHVLPRHKRVLFYLGFLLISFLHSLLQDIKDGQRRGGHETVFDSQNYISCPSPPSEHKTGTVSIQCVPSC